MEEAAVRVFWSPSPPAHAVTCVTVTADGEPAWVYTGGSDGAIVRWQLDAAAPPKAVVMLVGHSRAVRHLAAGLRGSDGARFLFSVDDAGGCCLWREPEGRCEAQRHIPQLANATFAEAPPPDFSRGPLTAGWLLAALPAPAQHHRQHPHQHPQLAAAAATPPHGAAVAAGGGEGCIAAASCCPVALLLDWRTLSFCQLLPMQPLQQLVCVESLVHHHNDHTAVAAAAAAVAASATQRFSSGGAGDTSPASRHWAMDAADHDGGGDGGGDPASALLCLRWGCCAAPELKPQPQPQAQCFADPLRSGSQDGVASPGNGDGHGGGTVADPPGGGGTAALAVAVTAAGTLYGCVLQYDPYKPPVWALAGGYGDASGEDEGNSEDEVAGYGGSQPTSTSPPASPPPPQHQRVLTDVREPLLAAAVSNDLRWALLGAVDAWVVLEARWRVAPPPYTTLTSTAGGGGGHGALPPRVLRVSYTAKCRISLMHQPTAASAIAVAPSGRQRRQAVIRGNGDGGGGDESSSSIGSDSDLELKSGKRRVGGPLPQRRAAAPSAPHGAGGSPAADAAATTPGQRPQLPPPPFAATIRTAAHLLLLSCQAPELPSAPVAAAGSCAPVALPLAVAEGATIRGAPAAAVPAGGMPGSSAADGGGGGGETDKPSGLGHLVVDELAGGSPSDLARLSFAVYLPHSDGDGSSVGDGAGGSVGSCWSGRQQLQRQNHTAAGPPPAQQSQPPHLLRPPPLQQQLEEQSDGATEAPRVSAAAAAMMNGRHAPPLPPEARQLQEQRELGRFGSGHSPPAPISSQLEPLAAPYRGDSFAGFGHLPRQQPPGCQAPTRGSPLELEVSRNHHYPHPGHPYRNAHAGEAAATASPETAVVLQALSWDGAGRQQVVSLTSDGRILAVRELPTPPAAAAACNGSNGSSNSGDGGGGGEEPPGAREHEHSRWRRRRLFGSSRHFAAAGSPAQPWPDGLACRGFCCHLSSAGGGVGGCEGGGRAGGGGLAGWVLGIHSYTWGNCPPAATVLQWPLHPRRRRSLTGSPGACTAAAVDAAEQAGLLSRPPAAVDLGPVNAAPLVGSLQDGWAGAAAATAAWRAHASRRRRASRRAAGYLVGDGGVGGAVLTRGSVPAIGSAEGCCGGGGGARSPELCGGGDGSDGADDDVARDSDADQVRRRVNGMYDIKGSRSGSGSAAAAATSATSAVGGEGGGGGKVSAMVGTHSLSSWRRRRRASGGGSGDGGGGGLPSCLYERWDETRKRASCGTGGRSWAGREHDGRWPLADSDIDYGLLAAAAAGEADGSSGAAAATAVVSTSVLTCDGTAASEAVILHCTGGGDMHFCDAAAYAVPAVHGAAEGSPRALPSRHGLAPAADRGDGTGGGTGHATQVAAPPLLRPCRAGTLVGHIGPVTCQLEVDLPIPTVAANANAVNAISPFASPSPPASPENSHHQPFSLNPSPINHSNALPTTTATTTARRVLLTGGSDGSLRAWHTHACAGFGTPVFAVHPHGAPVRRLLLPRGAESAAAPPEYRSCVVSCGEDGSVALVCLERRLVVRVCRTYPYGMPEVVSWSFRRGFLACGGHDPLGRWTVAVYDIAPAVPSLDRLAIGPDAAAILDDAAGGLAAHPYLASGDAGRSQQQYHHHHHHHHGLSHNHHHHHHHQPSLFNSLHAPPHPPQQQQHPQQHQQRPVSYSPQSPPLANSQQAWQALMRLPLQDGGVTAAATHASPRAEPPPPLPATASRGLPYARVSHAALQPTAALVAAESGNPCLAPVWAYGGSFRTLYCKRPDVVLAAIDCEPLLGGLAAADAAVGAGAAAAYIGGGGSLPMAVPRGQRGSSAAAAAPLGSSVPVPTLRGVLSPANASPGVSSISPCSSRRASLDLTSAVGGGASVAAMAAAAPPLRSSRLGVSRFSFEADRSVGGCSVGAVSSVGGGGGSRRPSLEEPAPHAAAAVSTAVTAAVATSGGVASGRDRALAALVGLLHSWTSDGRVDRALEAEFVELGLLARDQYYDPWVRDPAGAACAANQAGSALTHGSVTAPPPHRAHSAPQSQTCACEGSLKCQSSGMGRQASGGGGGLGATAGVAAAGIAGLSAGCSPQERTAIESRSSPQPQQQRQVPPPHHHHEQQQQQQRIPVARPEQSDTEIMSPVRESCEEYDSSYNGSYGKPCLVQPALVSACGAVALAIPQAPMEPRLSTADPWVVGDATVAAARLLNTVSLAGALGSYHGAAAAASATSRAAVRAASQVRHLCLVTARDAVAAERAAPAAAAPPPAATSACTAWPRPRRLLEPDLSVFARRWLAADPWVREAAQVLLSAYTKPSSAPPESFLEAGTESAVAEGATAAAAGVTTVAAPSPPPPSPEVVLPRQVLDVLRLRSPSASGASQPVAASPERRRRPSGSWLSSATAPPPSLPAPPPQRLYPAAVIAAAACLAHTDAVPRQLLAAAASSLVELLCLPLTLQQAGGGGTAGAASGGGGGLWAADGRVLLPEVAAATLTAALRGRRAAVWREQLQPWPRFVDRLLRLAHVIPLPPPPGVAARSYDSPVAHTDIAVAAASPPGASWTAAAGTRGATPGHHQPASPTMSPSGGAAATSAAAAATPQRAARQLADQVVGLLVAVELLDIDSVLDGLARFAGGESLPLHPLVAATLGRLAASRTGRCRLAVAAPALGALLAAAAAAPAARGRPDLARPAYCTAADLAAALPCAALHAASFQLAVAPPLAAASSPSVGEPQFITVYDLEHGNATWQLPLQPGPDALQPPPAGGAAAWLTAPPPSPLATAETSAGNGGGGRSSSGGAKAPCPAAATASVGLPALLRGVAQAGVAALQFSPQGDHLAVLALDGAPCPALLVFRLHLPWPAKLMGVVLQGGAGGRPALVVQPCHAWLLPGLLTLPAQAAGAAGAASAPATGTAASANLNGNGKVGAGSSAAQLGQQLGQGGAGDADVGGPQPEAKGEENEEEDGAAAAQRPEGREAGTSSTGRRWPGPQTNGQAGQQRQQQQERQEQQERAEGDRDARLGRVVDRLFGLRWSGPGCVELVRGRTAVLARFMLPGHG